MANSFSGKKILFIAPVFFGYEKKIILQMEKQGAEVSFIQENIDCTSFKEKIINKMPDIFKKSVRQKYFVAKINELSQIKFDVVFGIRMDAFDEVILSHLRNTFKKAQYICYFWDSIKSMRNAVLVASYFDKVFTFDREDANLHKEWIFRPLFYCDEYREFRSDSRKDIDILFVASLSPERAKMYNELTRLCKENHLKMFSYFYCKPYVYIANRFTETEYRTIPWRSVHGVGISTNTLLGLYSKSRVIFDCSSIYQTGLTMRTIECFGARKRMITTNKDVTLYDLYNANNILVVSEDTIDSIPCFLESKDRYEIQNEDIYYFYSLQGWLDFIFKNSDMLEKQND